MHFRTLFLCTVLGSTICSSAFAAANVEVVQHPSLLQVGDFTHVLGFTYSYGEHSGTASSGSAHALSEFYNVKTTMAVYQPEIATLNLDAGIVYQQSFATQSSNFLDTRYSVLASLLTTSDHPLYVNSNRTTTFIATGYTPSYSLTSTATQISGSILNKLLPLHFTYGHTTSDTSGLFQDYGSTGDNLSLSVSHSYRDRSLTQGALDYSTSSVTNGRESKAYSVFLSNDANLDKVGRYRLHSSLHFQELKPVDVPQSVLSITESLSCRFGAALAGNLAYNFGRSSSVNFQGVSQKSTSSTVSASLTHKLYQSLSTGISTDYSTSNAFGGRSTSYGGNLAVNYFKLLPAASTISLGTTVGKRTTDQEVLQTQATAQDESFHVVQQGDFFTPKISGQLTSVASVRSLNPDITYIEGVDYRVDLPLNRVEILVGGAIAPGTDLLISYTVTMNPNITYHSDSYQMGGMLSLLGGRYSVAADYSKNQQSLDSGQALNAPLNSSTMFSMRGDAKFGHTTAGVEYADTSSTAQKFSRFAAHANHNKPLSRTDFLTLNVRDDYYMYHASSTLASSYNENVFSVGGSYSTRFWDLVRASVSVGINDSRSKYASGDSIALQTSMGADYRKLSVSMSGSTTYRVSGNLHYRDTNLTISATRSF